jgi:hypothetical protein
MKPDSPKKTVKKSARPSAETPTPAAAKAAGASSSSKPKVSARGAKTSGKSSGKGAGSTAEPAARVASGGPADAPASARRTKSPAPGESPSQPSARATALPPIPPILLEGDESPASRPSGPGDRFVLGAIPSNAGTPVEPAELPESYGTQKLFLTARDPQWVYAHWDFSQDQLRRYNSRSVDRHLILRVYRETVEGDPHREIHVHPESRSWFAHVGQGSTRYVAQLGYYMEGGSWVALATSGATATPPDSLSDDLSAWFETLPVEVKFDQVLRLVRQAIRDSVPLMEALQQLRSLGYPGLPDIRTVESGQWTSEQEQALANVVTMDSVRRVWMGSLEITELIRRQFLQELSSQAAAAIGESGSWSGAVSSLSSPFGGVRGQPKGFWFNVNAELIIYGATEPDATVTIGGRTIRLRPDGSFSYRFILPDGRYQLPAVATSADGTDSRSAALEFGRTTQYRGEVHAHPQDPAMKPPRIEHVS